ncbi:MAG: anti-sigma F factor [Oscillospiraceae bacterium]|nr:anti-sigma F factor [Oscillospiraceae bacterium]
MKAPLNEVRLRFLSRSRNEAFIRSAVAAFCAPADPTLEELGDIKTAVSEAVTNCIVHAYPDSLGWIAVRARLFEDGLLELTVRDRGRGIENIAAARAPMFTTGGAERSGMGFTIMESFMDLVRVRSAPGKGTTLTLRRRLHSRETSPARS